MEGLEVTPERPPSTRSRRIGLLMRSYDRKMFRSAMNALYEESDFYNWGYWTAGVASQREACERLCDALLEPIAAEGGRLLDVACGKGATTAHFYEALSRRSPGAWTVTGINMSERQLARARERAPGCSFARMDAVDLDFEDDSLDALTCVEAAFHFDTRERFLHEALRVLKPRGTLVVSDVLFSRWGLWINPGLVEANWLSSPAAYAALLERVGFESVSVRDVTRECKGGHLRHRVSLVGSELRAGRLDPFLLHDALIRGAGHLIGCQFYVLAAATKPETAITASRREAPVRVGTSGD